MELKETKGTQGTQGYLESQITNMYSDLIFKRTYARTQGESWGDAVERYETYFAPRVPEKLKDDFKRAIELFKEKELVGSMRALATAGGPLELYPEALYNCSYLVFESYRDFADMLMLLMLGVGVGYSIEPEAISGLPKRPKRVLKSDIKITVADSKEGWRDSFLALLELLNDGLIPDIDYSEIRPAGTPLKTFGGTASGPEPLKFLFEQTIRLFETGAGKPWSPEEVFDLANSIAYAVISGGVRRSACIALAESKDALKLKPKDFWSVKPWRSYSNISVTDMNNLGISRYIEYLRENGTGEPGIFNREKAQERLKEVGREPEEGLLGSNPCLPKDALILTSEGVIPIGELAKLESFDIVNKDGKITKGKAWFTGVKDVYQVYGEFSKLLLEATADHKVMTNTGEVVEVKDLKGKRLMPFIKEPIHDKDLLLMGFLQGDGTLTHLYDEKPKAIYNLNHKKDKEIISMVDAEDLTYREVWRSDIVPKMQEWGFNDKHLIDRELPEHMKKLLGKDTLDVEESKEIKGFLSGLFSANGSVISKYRVALKTSNKNLAHQVKNLLKLVGIDSYITTNKERKNQFPNGVYTIHESYDVTISQFDSILKFANEINFIQKYKQKALRELVITRAPKVRKVVYKGKEEVYDFSEPETHFGVVNGFIVHNCGEILLRPFQFCNLTEVNVKPGDTLDFLKEKVKAATLLGALQSQNYPENLFNPKWLENAKKEPLLGVSLTGLRTHEILGEVSEEAKVWLQELHKEAREYAELLGNLMGLNFTAVTTVKPSGTTSQILGTTSGLHPSFSKYYLRRLRIHKHDPLVETLRKAPVHFEGDSGNSETLVMEFPLSIPNHKDRDLIDQLEYYKMFSENWTDHNPSCTITVKDNEWDLLGQWLQENLQDVIGITFLPEVSDYPQAPYEKLTEEEYYERLKEWEGYFEFHSAYPKGNFEKPKVELFANLESLTSKSNEVTFACTSGTCEIDTL